MRTARAMALHLASIRRCCERAARLRRCASMQPSNSIVTSWCGEAAATPVSTPTLRYAPAKAVEAVRDEAAGANMEAVRSVWACLEYRYAPRAT